MGCAGVGGWLCRRVVLGGCVCRWVVLVCWVYVCVCVLTLRCADSREFLQPFLQCRQHTEVNGERHVVIHYVTMAHQTVIVRYK